MSQETFTERKLAAILSADVKGYSRLMSEDDEATVRTLTARQEVMTTLIQQHRGRVVDSPGDNLLAEFASVVNAVRCAVEIQQDLRTRNAQLPDHRKMEFRIGINLGDVIVEGQRIYGDGVNIAARLEGLAEAGGICISGTVYDQIENKLALMYEYLGEQTVKNIAKPVRVYRVKMESSSLTSTVNTPVSEESNTLITSPEQTAEEKQQVLSVPHDRQEEKRGWSRPQLSVSFSLLVVLAVILSLIHFPKEIPGRNSASVLPVETPPSQSQQVLLPVDTALLSHRSDTSSHFETVLPPQNQRGLSITDKSGRQVGMYKESHALVIGVSDHTGGWPSLPGVKRDVKAVVPALEKQGFHVVVVMDPNLAELEEAYRDFITKYGLAPDNRLLFYFAGSAYTLKPAYALNGQEDWMGYLVTRDAPLPTNNPEGFRRHALSMERFASVAREIEAKHVLFLFDVCFGGAIGFVLGSPHPSDTNSEITQRTLEPVRQFISSGTADQKVPDDSEFRRQFITALEGAADRDGDGYVTGSELGVFLQEKITAFSRGTQTPQYGKMSDPRLNRGDFVFAPSLTVSSPVIATLPPE
jgi:class 3 adenylate cyclase